MQELKPCPWCGAQPRVSRYSSKSFGDQWQVECANDKCWVEAGTSAYDSENKSLNVWNTRAPQPDPLAFLASPRILKECISVLVEKHNLGGEYVGEEFYERPMTEEVAESYASTVLSVIERMAKEGV